MVTTRAARLLVGLFAATALSATTLQLTATGTFDGSAPVTPLSAPGETFVLTLDIEQTPNTVLVEPDLFWVDPGDFTNVDYSLDGVEVYSSASALIFFASPSGGFNIEFSPTGDEHESLVLEGTDLGSGEVGPGPQLFTGSTSSPTMELYTGTEPLAYQTAYGGSSPPYTYADASSGTLAGEDSAPEPSSAITLLAGLVVISVTSVLRRKRIASLGTLWRQRVWPAEPFGKPPL